MDARRLRLTGFVCLVFMSMLMFVACQDADNTACISTLAPCAPYLNDTKKPDSSCCTALKSVIDKDAQCLCNLLNSDAVKQLGVNVTQALKLPAECGRNASASQCNNTTAGSSSTGKTPTSTPPSPKASTTTTTKSTSNAVASVYVKMLPVVALVFVAVASIAGLEGPCSR